MTTGCVAVLYANVPLSKYKLLLLPSEILSCLVNIILWSWSTSPLNHTMAVPFGTVACHGIYGWLMCRCSEVESPVFCDSWASFGIKITRFLILFPKVIDLVS